MHFSLTKHRHITSILNAEKVGISSNGFFWGRWDSLIALGCQSPQNGRQATGLRHTKSTSIFSRIDESEDHVPEKLRVVDWIPIKQLQFPKRRKKVSRLAPCRVEVGKAQPEEECSIDGNVR